MDKPYFIQLADYNRWANEKLYSVVETLTKEEFNRDCDVFFHSVCATLNHILVGDMAWLGRLTGQPKQGLRLNDVLYTSYDDLLAARQRQDGLICDFCNSLEEDFLKGDLCYQSITAGQYTAPVKMILGHVFNHQTHHRGHVHAALSRLGKNPPDLDLIYFALGY